MIAPGSILSGWGVLSGRGILSGSGILTVPDSTDPLAGIPFALRLQTHRGDGVPLGLYQDTACTIPATADGHVVAAWRDELSGSGIVATQSITTKRPVLRVVSGKPVVRFDGVDDFLTIPAPLSLSQALVVISARIDSTEFCIFNTGVFDDFTRYNDGNGYWAAFRGSRIDQYPNSVPPSGSHVLSVASGASYEGFIDGVSAGARSGDFSAGGPYYIGATNGAVPFKGDIVAIYITEQITARELLETHIPATS